MKKGVVENDSNAMVLQFFAAVQVENVLGTCAGYDPWHLWLIR